MKHLYVHLVVITLLTACGSGPRYVAGEAVQNPYVKRANTLAEVGISAMQGERWDYALNVFARALKEAQLSDDLCLVTKQWYNLGAAHVAAGDRQEGLRDFHAAQVIAERAGDSVMTMRIRLARALLPGQANTWQPDLLAAKYPVDIHLAAARLAQKQKRYHVAKQEYDVVLKQRGRSRMGVLYRAQAHLGLAMLAREEQDVANAKQEVEASLGLLRQVGSPRLTAYALLFYGGLEVSAHDRRQSLQRALVIYQALGDVRGQRVCLIALAKIENHVGDVKSVRAYQQHLESLQGRKD